MSESRTSSTWKVAYGKCGCRERTGYRAIYVTARERRVVIVRAFVKKTQKTPRKEIEIALDRAREVHE
jgi:phage-related protein